MTSDKGTLAGPQEPRQHGTRTPAEIRADLEAIAPLPDEGSGGDAFTLALHFAVRAQERWARMLIPFSADRDQNYAAAMAAEFAAAHAIRALHRVSPGEADLVADQIGGALEDGGGIGEWLWDHLRTTADKVTELAEELDEAVAAEPKAGSVGETRAFLHRSFGIPHEDTTHYVIAARFEGDYGVTVITCCDSVPEASGMLAAALSAITGEPVVAPHSRSVMVLRDDLRHALDRLAAIDPEVLGRLRAAAGLLPAGAVEAVKPE